MSSSRKQSGHRGFGAGPENASSTPSCDLTRDPETLNFLRSKVAMLISTSSTSRAVVLCPPIAEACKSFIHCSNYDNLSTYFTLGQEGVAIVLFCPEHYHSKC